MTISRERLADLLIEPNENLDCEIKNWLDLQNSNSDKATLAKAILALANHGGGTIILGLAETPHGIRESEGRPANLDNYNQDLINGIAQNYCDPAFHCTVHLVPNPDGAIFPIIYVPGGHKVPVMARRAGPHGVTVTQHAIYIRKPGPRSESPQNAQDWDALLARCLRNRRDEMFDQIRDLIAGAVPQIEEIPEPARLDEWIAACRRRWQILVDPLPPGVGPRFPHGGYTIAYEIEGTRRDIAPGQIAQTVSQSVVRRTGWPPFWYPTRAGIEPYPIDSAIECWLGGDPQNAPEDLDAGHSDFWRIHPDGLAFLMRGFQEDGEPENIGGPGTKLDITLPVWRVGESLLHAQSLANNLFEGPTTIRFRVIYEGLAGRTLASFNGRRNVRDDRIAHQDSITLDTHIETQMIDQNLPEIVHPLLSPLYALFDFLELPMQLVVEELNRMRGGQF